MQPTRSLFALCTGATLFASSLLTVNMASAHGWVTSPPSRQDHCAKGRTSFDCGQVQYEPQSVEAPKGSMLCSGGSAFTILNNHSLAWPVTSVGGTTTFTWYCTACHRTASWEYFLSNGTRIASFSGNNNQPSQTTSHTVSGIPSGRQRILARWNIGDTAAAFYACIDVNVGGGTSPTPTPGPRPRVTPTPTPTPRPGSRVTPTPTPTATPSSRPTPRPSGSWSPGVYYPVGATVTYNSISYRCLQAHTAQVGWEPPTTPALWQRL